MGEGANAISLEEERSRGSVAEMRSTDLNKELAREREEVLRLRDLLIAKDRELGAALGRAAQLEAESRKMLTAVALLRRVIPGVFWVFLAKFRR